VVIVTEGEYKADQLAALGLLVTTSGAADSAGEADWQALAGRDVLIWPDNDAPGRHYADAVLAGAEAIGLQGEGDRRRPVGPCAKGDAVDWLASHPEAKAADVLGSGV
jgi:putative DNA primase/helicase